MDLTTLENMGHAILLNITIYYYILLYILLYNYNMYNYLKYYINYINYINYCTYYYRYMLYHCVDVCSILIEFPCLICFFFLTLDTN